MVSTEWMGYRLVVKVIRLIADPYSNGIPVNLCAPGFRSDLTPAAASATPRHQFAPHPAIGSALRVPPAAQLESHRSVESDLLVPRYVPPALQAAHPAFADSLRSTLRASRTGHDFSNVFGPNAPTLLVARHAVPPVLPRSCASEPPVQAFESTMAALTPAPPASPRSGKT